MIENCFANVIFRLFCKCYFPTVLQILFTGCFANVIFRLFCKCYFPTVLQMLFSLPNNKSPGKAKMFNKCYFPTVLPILSFSLLRINLGYIKKICQCHFFYGFDNVIFLVSMAARYSANDMFFFCSKCPVKREENIFIH